MEGHGHVASREGVSELALRLEGLIFSGFFGLI